MKEIEIKIKINSLKPIIKKLEDLGCQLSNPIVQNDIIFNEQNKSKDRNILRIRKSDNKCLFTLKKDVSDELDCIEKEIEINNPDTMIEIIEFLGFKESVRVNKKRIKCRYNDYEICLDDVERLGFFIEIEKFSDDDAEVVRKELLRFVESLGIDLSNRIFQGYDTMLQQKEV